MTDSTTHGPEPIIMHKKGNKAAEAEVVDNGEVELVLKVEEEGGVPLEREPLPERPAREDEPEIMAKFRTFQQLEDAFGKEMHRLLDNDADDFVDAIFEGMSYGEESKVWQDWVESHMSKILARYHKLEDMVESERAKFDAKQELVDKLLRRLQEAGSTSASKVDSVLATIESDFDDKHESRMRDYKFREDRIHQKDKYLITEKNKLEQWVKQCEADFRHRELDAEFAGMHTAYITLWDPQTKYNRNLAYLRDENILVNFAHPYWQGYVFGVWLQSTQALVDNNSRWHLMDTRAFHQEKYGLRTPGRAPRMGWFLGIQHGCNGMEDVLDMLKEQVDAGQLPRLEQEQAWYKFDEKPPAWLKGMEKIPHWLSKLLD